MFTLLKIENLPERRRITFPANAKPTEPFQQDSRNPRSPSQAHDLQIEFAKLVGIDYVVCTTSRDLHLTMRKIWCSPVWHVQHMLYINHLSSGYHLPWSDPVLEEVFNQQQ